MESQHREFDKTFLDWLGLVFFFFNFPPLWDDMLELTLIIFFQMLFFEGNKICGMAKLKLKRCIFQTEPQPVNFIVLFQ